MWCLKHHPCHSDMTEDMDGMQSDPRDACRHSCIRSLRSAQHFENFHHFHRSSRYSDLSWCGRPLTCETISGPLCSLFCNKLTPILMLQEKERLGVMEKRYHSLTGGKSFPKSSSAMREVRALNLLVCLQQELTGTSSNRQRCVAADNLRSDCSTRAAIIKTNLKINGCYLLVMEFLLMSRLISYRSPQ